MKGCVNGGVWDAMISNVVAYVGKDQILLKSTWV
jgi:hypothetical protein